MDDGDWDWIFEMGFWLFAPTAIVVLVLVLWACGVIEF